MSSCRRGFSYELVIVNDGSKDGTKAVVMEYVDRYGSDIVRFCDLHKNHGKGGAVRKVRHTAGLLTPHHTSAATICCRGPCVHGESTS